MVVLEASKNEDTWCNMLVSLKLQIRYSSKSTRGTVVLMACRTN